MINLEQLALDELGGVGHKVIPVALCLLLLGPALSTQPQRALLQHRAWGQAPASKVPKCLGITPGQPFALSQPAP